MNLPLPLPIIAITMGDPAGIGPEICLEALCSERLVAICQPLIFGDAAVLARVAAITEKPMPKAEVRWEAFERNGAPFTGPGIVDFDAMRDQALTPGKVHAATGRAAYRYIESAIASALEGRVAAVATGPIHKEALHAAGVKFPGHTEIFATLTQAPRTCMMLTAEMITCSLVTTHIGLREVAARLSVERIFEVIQMTAETMKLLRGREPRLIVTGLNPHAGEHGLFGEGEEERFIIPAIEQARALGVQIEGPLPGDTAFLPHRVSATDAYVCMYHDQGLIPLKMLAFETALNMTLGLPIIRTSVDHGTALDIAWQGKARSQSLEEAILLAAKLSGFRNYPAA